MSHICKRLLVGETILPGNPAFIKISPVKVTELTPNWYTGTEKKKKRHQHMNQLIYLARTTGRIVAYLPFL